MTLYNLGDFPNAISKFDEAYRLVPNPDILFNLGQSHRQNKQYEQAIFNFSHVLAAQALRDQPEGGRAADRRARSGRCDAEEGE